MSWVCDGKKMRPILPADLTRPEEAEKSLVGQGCRLEGVVGSLAAKLLPGYKRAGSAELIGKTLAHYEIQKKLGRGGMGEVFLARDQTLDRRVALKLLTEELEEDETAKKRFLREAQSAGAALDHPYICKIYEIGEAEGKSFIAMGVYRR